MLSLERISTNYAVDIPRDDMVALLAAESLLDNNPKIPFEEALSHQLDAITGVRDTEYNGHFGAAIYFTLDFEHDTPETHQQITATIAAHLQRCTSR